MEPPRWTFSIALVLAVATAPAPAVGENSSTAAGAGDSLLSGFLEQVVRDQLKTEYIDDDDWGKTRRVTVGYRVTGKPFEWDLKRRTKEVNHGLWEKYKVRLVDPDENLNVQFTRLEFQNGKLQFGLSLTAKLDGDARLERWRQGIKMLNAHVEARGDVRVSLEGEVGFAFKTVDGSPAVALEPAISKVRVRLLKFDLNRISKLDGAAAHELGDSLKGTIQDELDRRAAKIAAKLNKSIQKRKDRLVLSPAQFAKTGWAKLQEQWSN